MLWDMSTDEWITSFAFVTAMAFICGWLADRIMGVTGFGVIGNWLLLSVFSYLGMFAWNLMGYSFDYQATTAIFVATASACAGLLLMTGVKTVTMGN